MIGRRLFYKIYIREYLRMIGRRLFYRLPDTHTQQNLEIAYDILRFVDVDIFA